LGWKPSTQGLSIATPAHAPKCKHFKKRQAGASTFSINISIVTLIFVGFLFLLAYKYPKKPEKAWKLIMKIAREL